MKDSCLTDTWVVVALSHFHLLLLQERVFLVTLPQENYPMYRGNKRTKICFKLPPRSLMKPLLLLLVFTDRWLATEKTHAKRKNRR